jgi:uncharacterized surface protein with fasciclin (FAS1) repeats
MKLSIALITLFAGVASADVQRLRSSSLHDEAVDMYLELDAAADAEIQPGSRRHLQEGMLMSTTTVAPEGKTIVEIAVENGSFTTLVAAVTAAGLVEALSGPGPLTVLGKIFLILFAHRSQYYF